MNEPENRAYYDDFSHGYENERNQGYHALIDEIETEILRPFATDKTVLEAGCGTGLILERVARVAKSACGVDLSRGMVQKAYARGQRVLQGSVTHLPFANESFDLVCSFKVLAHVPDIGQALAELARVTVPGGHLVLEFYNPWSLRYVAKRLGGPQPISPTRTEADVYTRWDSPWVVPKILPPSVELLDYRGVRVVTPTATVHKMPLVASLFGAAERALVDSPLRYLGGFLVAILRKRVG